MIADYHVGFAMQRVRYAAYMTPLGPLAGESPEPMTRDDFERVQRRVRASFAGDVLVDRADVLLLLDEVRWLRGRLRRVEHAVEPLVEVLTGASSVRS